jgi:alkanesulfonate monooxygenase SsuD/methylene tetrahydromethanopterin reductase-like flavin-dependent oxidoreductase (luciferase family)
MAALTMDHLSAGRFTLGLGLSGRDLVRGWYGQPFDPPLGRTRDYLAIVRRVLDGDEPVTYEGRHLSLPPHDGDDAAPAYTSTVRPFRSNLPIVLGAEGPRNVALAREIADGWIATYYSPYRYDGKHKEAAAQIPTWLVEHLALIGPPGKIREELPAWRNSLLTTLLVHLSPHPPTLRQVADLVLG